MNGNGWGPYQFPGGWGAALSPLVYRDARLRAARLMGCACRSAQQMESWYGPYCSLHRPWPQSPPNPSPEAGSGAERPRLRVVPEPDERGRP